MTRLQNCGPNSPLIGPHTEIDIQFNEAYNPQIRYKFISAEDLCPDTKQTHRIIVTTIAKTEMMMEAASNRHTDGTLNADGMLDVMNTVENGAALDFSVTSRPFESILRRRFAVESNFRSASSSS
jgi:hypothetical protein